VTGLSRGRYHRGKGVDESGSEEERKNGRVDVQSQSSGAISAAQPNFLVLKKPCDWPSRMLYVEAQWRSIGIRGTLNMSHFSLVSSCSCGAAQPHCD
jgi:hypothetical protein